MGGALFILLSICSGVEGCVVDAQALQMWLEVSAEAILLLLYVIFHDWGNEKIPWMSFRLHMMYISYQKISLLNILQAACFS